MQTAPEIVSIAITAERRDDHTALDAIRQACSLRCRPSLMTTMAATLVGLPLMLGRGAGSGPRRSLAWPMEGGGWRQNIAFPPWPRRWVGSGIDAVCAPLLRGAKRRSKLSIAVAGPVQDWPGSMPRNGVE